MKQKRLQYKIAVWLTMGLMVMDPLVVPLAYAENPIEVDRNAPQHRQAQVGQAANGITLVNIAGPTAGGVSRNDYTNFNVPQNGVILNNSYQMANTSLAGYVPGNANMMRGSASVIVNEVTSHNPTNMNGFIEVAGRKASVVVANPNGITVDGGGFINTDRAVLTTGKPEYDPNGNLNTYRVEQGSIAINGKGLNAKESNSLQILTEAAQVNAGVWANAVETRTGKNIIDAKSLESKALGSSNQIGLDVSAIGGMYANSITMKGTNDGLGVNVKGTLSSVHATNISADGMIQVDGGITSNGQTSISGHAISVGQDGVVQGDNGLSIESQSSMTNHGLVNSNGTTDIHAKSVDNAENGRIYGNTVSIKADTVSNHTDATIEARYTSAADVLTQAKEALDKEWNADITAYKSKEELQAHRNRIQELTKTYDKAQEAMTKVQKELDSHKSGTIASRDHMDIQANEIHNNGNALLYSGNTMNLTGSHVIENKGATIQSGGEMTLTTSNLVNDNASFGMKRVSDGITKHGDKLKVDDKNHPEENQIFDVSEFPGYTGKGGYGVAHKVPVKQADGTIKMVDKGVPPVKNFTLIRSEEEHTHTEVTNNQPGVISAGGNIVINGTSSNINSKIASAGQVIFNGAHETISDKTSDKVFKTGTTQVSEAKRVHKAHGYRYKWRRYWEPEVFMTPSIEEQNIQPIGTIQEHAEDTIAEANKRKVNDSLDPFGTGNQGKSSIGNVTIEGLKLPTQAIYNIHPDITANALIETDSAFTNRKKFVSSEYMLNALANDPERRMKRLGDGFYEQGLINSQILSATGKPYLEGYTDNESEYKALLEAGISYGKKYKLTPGITLSEEQMKAITTDMVWLETKTIVVNGQPQQVLYPKVYLAKQSANQIDAMGAVVSGKSIIANTDSAFKNSGNMMADSIVVQANTVDNTGRFNANTVAIGATDSIRNTGAIHGNDSVILRANNDINVVAETHQLANQDVLMQQGRIGVSNPKGTIDIHSNKDVHLTGAIITGGNEGNISITSANTVNLDTKKLSAKKDMTLNAANYLRTDRGTEIGTQILGDGNVTVAAKNDVNIRQGVINSEHGATTIVAGNDVNIENGNTYSRDQYGLQYKEKGLLSRTVNTIRKDYEHTGVTASTIGGNTIQVGANHDVNVTGSNVLGTGDVVISAGNKVRTNSAEDSSRNDTYQHSKKKGLMGAGLGFTIGSKQIKDTEAESYTTNVNTLIGSVDGTIAINANNDAHITSTDIVGKHGITVSAADITLDGNHDVAMSKQVHEEKQSGLTVSLGGSIASALNTAHGLQHKASSRNDKRLATLENIEAGKELKKGYEKIKEYKNFTVNSVREHADNLLQSGIDKMETADDLNKFEHSYKLSPEQRKLVNAEKERLQKEGATEYVEGYNDMQDINGNQKQYKAKKRAKKDGLANIHVSIGSSKSRSETTLNSRKYAGGQLVSAEGITLVARPNMQDKGNIVAIGETIRGKSVTIDASKDISLLAGINTHENQAIYDSKSWSIGANLSVNGGGLLGLDANYNQGMERGNTFKTTHTGTVIQADQVNLHSDKDTTIAGSKVYGDSVTAEIGGNLAIKSLQDTETYRGKSKNVGFSVSTNGLQLSSVSAEYTNGTMKSDYASVTDQAGIYAGTGGFAIHTQGSTELTGAVIDSAAPSDKNLLDTKLLKMKDIQNTAKYDVKSHGLQYNNFGDTKSLSKKEFDSIYKDIGLTPTNTIGAHEKVVTHTYSAIKNSIIKVNGDIIDIRQINTDINHSVNQLDRIFDKRKIEEREKLSDLFSQNANEAIHRIAKREGWKDGDSRKVALHAIFGGITTDLAGGTFGDGIYVSSANEILQKELQKYSGTIAGPNGEKYINPQNLQWFSTVLGYATNKTLGKNEEAGAFIARMDTKYNANAYAIPFGIPVTFPNFVSSAAIPTSTSTSSVTSVIRVNPVVNGILLAATPMNTGAGMPVEYDESKREPWMAPIETSTTGGNPGGPNDNPPPITPIPIYKEGSINYALRNGHSKMTDSNPNSPNYGYFLANNGRVPDGINADGFTYYNVPDGLGGHKVVLSYKRSELDNLPANPYSNNNGFYRADKGEQPSGVDESSGRTFFEVRMPDGSIEVKLSYTIKELDNHPENQYSNNHGFYLQSKGEKPSGVANGQTYFVRTRTDGKVVTYFGYSVNSSSGKSLRDGMIEKTMEMENGNYDDYIKLTQTGSSYNEKVNASNNLTLDFDSKISGLPKFNFPDIYDPKNTNILRKYLVVPAYFDSDGNAHYRIKRANGNIVDIKGENMVTYKSFNDYSSIDKSADIAMDTVAESVDSATGIPQLGKIASVSSKVMGFYKGYKGAMDINNLIYQLRINRMIYDDKNAKVLNRTAYLKTGANLGVGAVGGKLGNNSSEKVMLGVGSSYVVDEQGTNFYDNVAKDTPTLYEQKLEKQKNDINNKSNTN